MKREYHTGQKKMLPTEYYGDPKKEMEINWECFKRRSYCRIKVEISLTDWVCFVFRNNPDLL